MNPALRVLKNSTVLSLSALLERGVAFFLPWYIARVQGKQVWGYYSLALTFITISSTIAYWGLDQLLPREIARDRTRAGIFLVSAGVIGSLISLLTAIVVIAIVYLLHYPPYVRHLICLGIITVLLPRTEATLCEAAINGLERMEWVVVVRFPITILRIIGSLFLLSRGFGLDGLFVALAIYYILVWGVYLLLFKRYISAPRLQFSRPLMKTLFIHAIPFVMTISVGETFRQIDRVFLSKFWNTDSVGIYSTGIMLVQIIYLIAPAIMNALFPVLSRVYLASQQRFSLLVSQTFKLLLVGAFPITLTIITFADWAILRIFGPEYSSSIAVLRIYALGIAPSFATRFLYRTILASNNELLAVRVAFVNSVVNLFLNAILIPRYGVLGASVSAAVTVFVGLSQNLFYVSRKVTRFDFTPTLLKPSACMLASVLVYIGVAQWNLPAAWGISLTLLAGMILASRTITRQDLVSLITGAHPRNLK